MRVQLALNLEHAATTARLGLVHNLEPIRSARDATSDQERKDFDTDAGTGIALMILGNAGIPMIKKPVATSRRVQSATPDIW
jgi:hypothetical protein